MPVSSCPYRSHFMPSPCLTMVDLQRILFVAWFLSFSYTETWSLRILVIAPGWSNSHVLFNYRLSKMLIDHGHNVTLLIPLTSKVDSTPPEGVDEIRVPIDLPSTNTLSALQDMAFQRFNALSAYRSMTVAYQQSIKATLEQLFSNYDLIDTLSGRQYNMALTQAFQLWPIGFCHRIGIDNIALVAPGAFLMDAINMVKSLPAIPSLVPNVFLPSSDHMTFMERLTNTLLWMTAMGIVTVPSVFGDTENRLYQEPPYHTTDTPDLWTLGQRTKAIFINGEMDLDSSRPLVPGVFYLGELEKRTLKPLPQEWREVMDESKGVIVFSFGTVANTTTMPMRLKDAFLSAFSKFPDHTILWRLEGQLPSGIDRHRHIKIVKWMPQRELLNHPKMKLFITHGGYNSLLESCDAGVPMVLVPLFADQHANAQKATRLGVGVVLDRFTATADQIEQSMRSVMSNSNFPSRARALSSILKDQIGDKRAVAVHRIEKIAKKSRLEPSMKAAERLNWLQYACLDVIAFFVLVILMIIKVSVIIGCKISTLLE